MHTVNLWFLCTNKKNNWGEASLKKNGKIWEKIPIRLDPSPLDNSELFENFCNSLILFKITFVFNSDNTVVFLAESRVVTVATSILS